MTIAEKITRAKTDYDEVYEAGKQAEYDAFWDSFQDNGNRHIYYYAFCGAGWNTETFKPKYKIVPIAGTTPAQGMFQSFGSVMKSGDVPKITDFTELSKMIDFSNVTRAQNTFDSATLKNLTVDFSNVTNMNNCFVANNGGTIENITIKVSEKCTSYAGTFSMRRDTTRIIFTEDSVIAASINFQYSPLTKESITSIINALSPEITGQTATFKETAKEAAFTAEEWAALIATKPNWTFSLV
jgi:hypothetical protein